MLLRINREVKFALKRLCKSARSRNANTYALSFSLTACDLVKCEERRCHSVPVSLTYVLALVHHFANEISSVICEYNLDVAAFLAMLYCIAQQVKQGTFVNLPVGPVKGQSLT